MKLNVANGLLGHSVGRWCSAALVASAVLLGACGGGTTTVEPFVPSRAIALGDGVADVGQAGGAVYSVNDGSNTTWVQEVAFNYGLGLKAQAAGGQGWARGNARIALKPDAVGSSTNLTLNEQFDAFLAGNSLATGDIIMLSGGTSDLLVQAGSVQAGTISSAQGVANAQAAGRALGELARRIAATGGKHVVVTGLYDLGRSPYAVSAGLGAFLSAATGAFNEALLINMVDLGANVLYVDAPYQYNLLLNQPSNYGYVNATTAACTTPTALTCTASTIAAGIDYNTYLFADDRYLTPSAQRSFGSSAYNRMKSRW